MKAGPAIAHGGRLQLFGTARHHARIVRRRQHHLPHGGLRGRQSPGASSRCLRPWSPSSYGASWPGPSASPPASAHSLIAGLTGAAIALQGGFAGINGAEWAKVIYGILLSTLHGLRLRLGRLESRDARVQALRAHEARPRVQVAPDRRRRGRGVHARRAGRPEVHGHLHPGHHAGHRHRPGGPDGAAHLAHVLLRAQHGPRHRRRRQEASSRASAWTW